MDSQSKPELAPEAIETYKLYWQVQYDRVAQHENGRYQVSAYVLAGSLVALGFITQLSAGGWLLWIATSGVALVNMLAMVFIAGELRWVKVHQARAAAVLEALAPDLVALQGVINDRAGFPLKSSNRSAKLRSSNTLGGMHLIVGLATILIAFSVQL